MAEGLSARMLMEHQDNQGDSLFTSQAWRRLFDIRGPLVLSVGPGAPDRSPTMGDLREYWMGISSAGDFLGTTPSQAPKKVTVTDLFYLEGMDVGSVNVPYLLARYLRLFVAGRKSGAHIYGGKLVARLADHFGLLIAKIVGGLTVIAPELPIIDMTELARLQICTQFDDTWAWVAMGPERQPDTAVGAPADAEDAPIIDEGDQAVPALVQAPQQPPPPPSAARTMPQRMARLEEDAQGLRRDGGSLRRLAFDGSFRGSSPAAFQRRTRQRTDGSNTSAAEQDP
ncbi:hypothetical protein Tco_1506123 [Tanacetum coccineum]